MTMTPEQREAYRQLAEDAAHARQINGWAGPLSDAVLALLAALDAVEGENKRLREGLDSHEQWLVERVNHQDWVIARTYLFAALGHLRMARRAATLLAPPTEPAERNE